MKLIIGNWKMFPPSLKEAKQIFAGIKKGARNITHAKVVICPPALYISSLIVPTSKIIIGGQNIHAEDEGARTGEISPRALASTGATYVILGHSERRAMGETDKEISLKLAGAIRNKLTAILCVGEKERDEHGAYFNEVSSQLRASLEGFPKNESKRLVVAYEPIWAIGAKAKRAARPEDFHEISILIRRYLTEYFGKKIAFTIPILYGGSADVHNAEAFLREGGADGLLVGRVSLDPEKFSKIIHIANTTRKS